MQNSTPKSKAKHTVGFAYKRMKNRMPLMAVMANTKMPLPPKVVAKKNPVSKKSMEVMEGRKDSEAKGKDKND